MQHCYPRFCLLVLLTAAFAAQAQVEPAVQYTTLTPAHGLDRRRPHRRAGQHEHRAPGHPPKLPGPLAQPRPELQRQGKRVPRWHEQLRGLSQRAAPVQSLQFHPLAVNRRADVVCQPGGYSVSAVGGGRVPQRREDYRYRFHRWAGPCGPHPKGRGRQQPRQPTYLAGRVRPQPHLQRRSEQLQQQSGQLSELLQHRGAPLRRR